MPSVDELVVTAAMLIPTLVNLRDFAKRYATHFLRSEQREHAVTYLEGLLSDLPRKTIEPIAMAHDQARRPLQRFVGAGKYDDESLLRELKAHVTEKLGDPAGVFIIDPSCFEKKGTESVGVARQWNGRIGKVDNCQKGVFLAYAAPNGTTIVDRRLYLPASWASNGLLRGKCHVPSDVEFHESWKLAIDMIDASKEMPHSWVVADDEFGRSGEFRTALRDRNERYALDVPGNTLVRLRLARQPRGGRRRNGPVMRADKWAKEQKGGAWVRVLLRDGTKEPHYVLAASAVVETRVHGKFRLKERLIVVKTIGPAPEIKYILSNAEVAIAIGEVVCAAGTRHSIEESFLAGKGESGLRHYEVRSWVGWHHHMTLSLMAGWFLVLECHHLKKNTADDCAADREGSCTSVA